MYQGYDTQYSPKKTKLILHRGGGRNYRSLNAQQRPIFLCGYCCTKRHSPRTNCNKGIFRARVDVFVDKIQKQIITF